MDILLRKTYSYTITSSYEQTRIKLKGILDSKWRDPSKEFYGSIDDDGNFTFKQKFVFISLTNFGRAIYLDGNLIKEDKNTIINIRLAPNLAFVFIIYLMPLISLNILFGDNSIMGQRNGRLNNFCVALLMEAIVFVIIQVASYILRRRFEKVMMEKKLAQK